MGHACTLAAETGYLVSAGELGVSFLSTVHQMPLLLPHCGSQFRGTCSTLSHSLADLLPADTVTITTIQANILLLYRTFSTCSLTTIPQLPSCGFASTSLPNLFVLGLPRASCCGGTLASSSLRHCATYMRPLTLLPWLPWHCLSWVSSFDLSCLSITESSSSTSSGIPGISQYRTRYAVPWSFNLPLWSPVLPDPETPHLYLCTPWYGNCLFIPLLDMPPRTVSTSC
jgi:hypothetical protein